MTYETALKLIKLNQDFYNTIGQYWNPAIDYTWQGWDFFVVKNNQHNWLLPKNKSLKVLDLGCGNCRFAHFLKKNFDNYTIDYVGIDNSDFLLYQAKANLKSLDNSLQYCLYKQDLILDQWDQDLFGRKFDLIVLFGVMHHIPSDNFRHSLIKKATQLLAKNGSLIFTTWNFLKIPRLQKRIVDLDSPKGQFFCKTYNIFQSALDQGDYILDWVKKQEAFRYSHSYDDAEINETIQKNNLKLIDRYLADGRTENQNEYFVCCLG